MARDRGLRNIGRLTKYKLIRRLQLDDNMDRQRRRKWLTDAAVYMKYKELLERHYCSLSFPKQMEFDKVLAARFDQILASTYTADSSRMSFIDLPAEIRNMIYRFSMFGGESSDAWQITTGGKGRHSTVWSRPPHDFAPVSNRNEEVDQSY